MNRFYCPPFVDWNKFYGLSLSSLTNKPSQVLDKSRCFWKWQRELSLSGRVGSCINQGDLFIINTIYCLDLIWFRLLHCCCVFLKCIASIRDYFYMYQTRKLAQLIVTKQPHSTIMDKNLSMDTDFQVTLLKPTHRFLDKEGNTFRERVLTFVKYYVQQPSVLPLSTDIFITILASKSLFSVKFLSTVYDEQEAS